MFKILSFLSLVLVLSGCQPQVTFTEPQPKGANHLKEIPSRLTGHYLSEDKASFIMISDKMILQTYDSELKTAKTDLPAGQKLTGDTLTDESTGDRLKVNVIGDSLVQHVHETDTLFRLSSGNVLTKFKGSFFLNSRIDNDSWSVQKLSLSKGVLELAAISTNEEIDNLRQVTEAAEDSTCYTFNPDRAEFRKFIRQNGFHKHERFYRISR